MAHSSQLTRSEYVPQTETRSTHGSPSHQDVPIHAATLASGELHARLDPVAYPQAGSKYAGAVAGVTYPEAGKLSADAQFIAALDYTVVLAPPVLPTWDSPPVLTGDTHGVADGWALSIPGHDSYQLILEYNSDSTHSVAFGVSSFNAPVKGLATGLANITGGKVVTGLYVIRAGDPQTRESALLLASLGTPAVTPVTPTGPVFSDVTLNGDASTFASGSVVLPDTTASHTWKLGVVIDASNNFAWTTLNAPITYDLTGTAFAGHVIHNVYAVDPALGSSLAQAAASIAFP